MARSACRLGVQIGVLLVDIGVMLVNLVACEINHYPHDTQQRAFIRPNATDQIVFPK